MREKSPLFHKTKRGLINTDDGMMGACTGIILAIYGLIHIYCEHSFSGLIVAITGNNEADTY